MIKSNFLNKLKRDGKIELVEPSEEMCSSYLKKSGDCLKSAKLLAMNNLYENSISMSYYAMYNSLLALLFLSGIKSENHSGSIIIFRKLFKRNDLYKIISFAKKERIDKQYYVSFDENIATKESAEDLTKNSEDFLIDIRIMIERLGKEKITEVRKNFDKI